MDNKYDEQMKKLGSYYLREHIPVSAEMIDNFEKELGCTLPKAYRVFLEKYGFSTQRGSATIPDLRRPGQPGGGVDFFYGLHPGESRDLLRKYKGFKGRIPDGVLPIADSPGGQVCLGIKGEFRGQVYWWDRSEPFENINDNLQLIGHDFESFINSLYKKYE